MASRPRTDHPSERSLSRGAADASRTPAAAREDCWRRADGRRGWVRGRGRSGRHPPQPPRGADRRHRHDRPPLECRAHHRDLDDGGGRSDLHLRHAERQPGRGRAPAERLAGQPGGNTRAHGPAQDVGARRPAGHGGQSRRPGRAPARARPLPTPSTTATRCRWRPPSPTVRWCGCSSRAMRRGWLPRFAPGGLRPEPGPPPQIPARRAIENLVLSEYGSGSAASRTRALQLDGVQVGGCGLRRGAPVDTGHDPPCDDEQRCRDEQADREPAGLVAGLRRWGELHPGQ